MFWLLISLCNVFYSWMYFNAREHCRNQFIMIFSGICSLRWLFRFMWNDRSPSNCNQTILPSQYSIIIIRVPFSLKLSLYCTMWGCFNRCSNVTSRLASSYSFCFMVLNMIFLATYICYSSLCLTRCADPKLNTHYTITPPSNQFVLDVHIIVFWHSIII